MQVVDGNAPVVVDTNSKVFAMNPVDTNGVVVAPITLFTNVNNGVCCGSNVTINATAVSNGGTNYNWSPTSNGTVTGTDGNYTIVSVNGLPPRARALSNDAQVLEVFFAVK